MPINLVVRNFGDNIFYDHGGASLIYGDSAGTVEPNGHSLGDDVLYGLSGDDTIYGDAHEVSALVCGNDRLYGGRGDDTIFGDARVLSDGAQGGADVLVQGKGTGELFGDASQMTDSAGGADTIRGAGALAGDALAMGNSTGGNDTISAAKASSAASIVGDGVSMFGGSIGGRDIITGSRFADSIYGDAAQFGSGFVGGDDVINGGAGDDEIWGDGIALVIVTPPKGTVGGDDIITGGAGDDDIWGDGPGITAPGDDVFRFKGVFGDDTLNDFGRGADVVRLQGFDAGDVNQTVTAGDLVIDVDGGGSITLLGVTTDLVIGDTLILA